MSAKVSGDGSLNDSLNGDQETEFSKPVGLTGLQNLGNTCYMNAGIQALSNCPQLTGFMMDCGSFIRKPGLAKAYHRLINDMWSSRRPSYVVPVGISQGIKKVCPAFKGYTQHDAQEFLRCLLDQLHEELKEAVVESQVVTPQKCNSLGDSRRKRTSSSQGNRQSSEEMSSDDNVEDYETCDSGLSWHRSIDSSSSAAGSNIRLNGHQQETESGVFLPSMGSNVTLMQSTEGSGQLPFVTSDQNGVHFLANKPIKHQENLQSKKKQDKNVTYRSVISDVFDGKLLSSVQCLTCDNVSTTKETFQDLSLSIPTRDQLNALRASSRRSDGTSSPTPSEASGGRSSPLHHHFNSSQSSQAGDQSPTTRGYTGVLWGWIEWLLGWFWGPSITLEDCLSAFFSADELKGDNMYSCEKCKKLRNGIKYSRVLHLPDILCVHLKRFRHDLSYSCKISAQVSFPLHGLDMAPYMVTPEEEDDDADRTGGTSSNVPPGKAGTNIVISKPWNQNEGTEESESRNAVTTYDLVSVICHHGTPSSGHYTAYCLNNYTDTWYEFDDQYVTAVDDNQVASCEAYVLFYRKTSDEVCERRYRAVQLIERAPKDFDATIYYISNQWINRFNTFADPGPISNRDFMCQHGKVDPLKAAYARELCMGFSREIWDYLVSTFSGGPPCNDLDSVCNKPSCLIPTAPSNVQSERINQIQNSKLLTSYFKHIGSNVSLDLPHGRTLVEAASTISLPATIPSPNTSRHVAPLGPLLVNGNGIHSQEMTDYTSLHGSFGFDARKDLKRRHEEKLSDSQPLLDRQLLCNGSVSRGGERKKSKNRILEKVGGDESERIPLISTNGCHESAIEEESDDGDDEVRVDQVL